jgi:hypothetical protein
MWYKFGSDLRQVGGFLRWLLPPPIKLTTMTLNTNYIGVTISWNAHIAMIKYQCHLCTRCWFGWFMVLNATFNNISVISWRPVLLVVETWVTGENLRPASGHWQTLSQCCIEYVHSMRAHLPLHHRCGSLDASTLTIKPPMWFTRCEHTYH